MIVQKYTVSLVMLFVIGSLFAQDLQTKELYKKTGITQRTDAMGGIGRAKIWYFDSLGRFVKSEIRIDGKLDGMTKYYYDTTGALSVSIDTSLFQYRVCKYYYSDRNTYSCLCKDSAKNINYHSEITATRKNVSVLNGADTIYKYTIVYDKFGNETKYYGTFLRKDLPMGIKIEDRRYMPFEDGKRTWEYTYKLTYAANKLLSRETYFNGVLYNYEFFTYDTRGLLIQIANPYLKDKPAYYTYTYK